MTRDNEVREGGNHDTRDGAAQETRRSALVDVPAEPVAGYRRRLPQYAFEHYEFEQPGYENPSISGWEALYTSPPLSREGEDSAEVDIPADLVKRCEEVLDWQKTGILQDGGELWLLASRIRILSQGEALSHAEEKTKREAMRLILALAATRSASASKSSGGQP